MIASLFLLVIGVCFGSFLSALAQRTVTKTPNWRGRSACSHCHKKLLIFDLIPVLSFVFLKNRCRFCKKKIGWREPATELAAGLLFVLVGLAHGNQINGFLARDLILSAFLLSLFLTDVYAGRLPHRLTITAAVVALAFNFALAGFSFQPLLGALICGGFFYLQYLISRGAWIGGGDIGLGVFLGAALGVWYGLWALGLAYVLGALVAVVLLATKKITLKSTMPFGPFLAVAGWVILIFTAL